MNATDRASSSPLNEVVRSSPSPEWWTKRNHFKPFCFKESIKYDTNRVVCTNVDPHLIKDQRNFTAKYLQNGEEN